MRTCVAALLIAFSATAPLAAQDAPSPASLELACNRDTSDACATLGIMYTNGDRVAIDLPRGATLFSKSCSLGDARGCMLWGYALQTGRGTQVDVPAGLYAYENACTRKNALGCNNAGLMHQAGLGATRDESKALERYTQSCELSLGIGCRNLGVLHADAVTLKQDRTSAVAAFKKGCAFGDMDSCNKLAWHLEMGRGTFRDWNKAQQLYAQACDGGFELACTNGRNLAAVMAKGRTFVTAPMQGANGVTVCSAFMSEGRKMFYSPPFGAASSRSNEFALGFAEMLRQKGYAAASMYAPKGSPPPALTVDCRWHATRDEATNFMNRLISGAQRERMTTVPAAFEPF